jgi:tetratricopeptide (TPR) repeat protein
MLNLSQGAMQRLAMRAMVSAIVAGVLMIAGAVISSAVAQTVEEHDWCFKDAGNRSPDLRIKGCSAVIQSGNIVGPWLAAAFNRRGAAFAKAGKYAEAIADFSQAIEIAPTYAETYYYNRGNSYYAQRHYDRAVADYTAAIQMAPVAKPVDASEDRPGAAVALTHDQSVAWYYFNRGLANRIKGNYEQATADCNQAIQLNPQNASRYYAATGWCGSEPMRR